MTEQATEAAGLADGDIVQIASDVWGSFLGMSLEQIGWPDGDAPGALPGTGPCLTACVTISGEWNGTVMLHGREPLATGAAAAMFDADPAGLGEDEVADAFGELANMVGGNIKSLLPAPSALSVPAVTGGDGYHVRVPHGTLSNRVALHCDAGVLLVTVWKV